MTGKTPRNLRLVTDSFDVVPIGPDDERTIVVRVVVRPQTWSAVVLAPCCHGCPIELIDLLAVLRHECQMQWRWFSGDWYIHRYGLLSRPIPMP